MTQQFTVFVNSSQYLLEMHTARFLCGFAVELIGIIIVFHINYRLNEELFQWQYILFSIFSSQIII